MSRKKESRRRRKKERRREKRGGRKRQHHILSSLFLAGVACAAVCLGECVCEPLILTCMCLRWGRGGTLASDHSRGLELAHCAPKEIRYFLHFSLSLKSAITSRIFFLFFTYPRTFHNHRRILYLSQPFPPPSGGEMTFRRERGRGREEGPLACQPATNER